MKVTVDPLTGLPVIVTEEKRSGGGWGGGISGRQSIVIESTAPTTGSEGILYQVSGDPTKLYYFLGSHRYRIDATLDEPIIPLVIPLWFTMVPQ